MAPAMQDQPNIDYRALCDAQGWPPIRGGEFQPGEPVPGAVEGGQGEQQATLDSFDPAQIPAGASPQWLAERHQQMMGDYTQKTQALAQERQEAEQARAILDGLQNPQTAPEFLRILGVPEEQILQAYGYEVAGEPEEPPDPMGLPPDPGEQSLQRVERLEQSLAQREEQQTAEAREGEEADVIEGGIAELEEAEDREFDDKEVSLITTHSRVHPLPNGIPDVAGAYQQLKGVLDDRTQAWIASKQAPRRPQGGSPGQPTADLSTEAGRMAAMQQAAEQAMVSEE